jgi:MFS family permease
MSVPRPVPAPRSPSRASRGLDWFSFFLADVQTGFGPFLAVYLTSEKWANGDIGLLFTIGSIAGLIGQVPAGALIDATRREKLIATVAVSLIGFSALAIALSSRYLFVIIAQILHVAASVCIGPVLAALSLKLVGHTHLGLRLGRNAQFASAGSIFAIIVMGASGYVLTSHVVFFITAVMTVPALFALHFLPPDDGRMHHTARIRNEHYSVVAGLKELASNSGFRVLALAVFFFHLANAGLMPLAANIITMRSEQLATILVASCLIVPQIVVTASSGWIGDQADHHGRKPFLICAFAALALRAVLFGFTREPFNFVALQILDGISAAIIGILVAVCVDDLTRDSGYFNLGLGVVGAAMGLGAAASTMLAGDLADWVGTSPAFILMSGIAVAGLAVLAVWMPETKTEGDEN